MESRDNNEPLFTRFLETLRPFVNEKSKETSEEVKVTSPQEEQVQAIPEEKNEVYVKDELIPTVDLSLFEQNIQQLNARFDDLSYLLNINRQLHEELQVYKNGLKRDVQMSLLKHMMLWHGKINDLYRFYDKKQQEPEVDYKDLFTKLLKEYKFLSDGVEDTLFDYDIEPVMPQVGEVFNPRIQKSVRIIETTEAEKDKTIASCVNIGFMDMEIQKLLKQPEVAVYKLSNHEELNTKQ
jgi:GrpE.